MERQELKIYLQELLNTKLRGYARTIQSKTNRHILDAINEYNTFCSGDYSICQKVYNIINDISAFPKCKNENCNNQLSSSYQFDGINRGYHDYCCPKCAIHSQAVTERRLSTLMDRYGVVNPRQNKEINEKAKQTTLERYGKTCYLASETGISTTFQSKLEKYGDGHYSNRELFLSTMYDRYGDNYFSDESNEKRKRTNLSKYGCEYVSQNEEVQKKMQQSIAETFQNNYGEGISNISLIPGKYEKSVKTFQKNHNVSGDISCIFQLSGFQEYTRNYFKENYGVEYYSQTDDYKIKSVEGSLKSCGETHWTKNHDLRVKAQLRYFFNNKSYDSSWEIAYHIWCNDHGINVSYQPDIHFDYTYDNTTFYYFPDFKNDDTGEIIEIKGLQYFRNRDPNDRMICPYTQKENSRHTKDWYDDQFEAKHQCMITNNVKILTSIDMKPILKYIKDKYGKDYLKQFKRK